MLNLFLLRHAKSNWETSDGSDREREINSEGEKKTKKIVNYIFEKKIIINQILCSPAKRTLQTSQIIMKSQNKKPSFKIIDSLYHSSKTSIFESVLLEAKEKSTMIISHEPILSESIGDFSSDYQNKHYKEANEYFPTSGLFQINFKASYWQEIDKYNSEIISFIKPNDLD